ncbi:uncharacterized protein CLUP02_10470 [Colletotrichum lupini]|uniref:Uncharacterized protein n=1 Tax=Colletotrichum lupini TaxID=145971 RepID=A0A9Q8SWN8_9PEZI|nr:uncharacterized protein CLUP02_10470 [Colletotrichum lupini]UQC84974.1 hypothetical protein CLUP02_10470 [Colletotrichum lupini]
MYPYVYEKKGTQRLQTSVIPSQQGCWRCLSLCRCQQARMTHLKETGLDHGPSQKVGGGQAGPPPSRRASHRPSSNKRSSLHPTTLAL